MPTKKPASLPDGLRYLQRFANTLAKLPPDLLNEDVDPSRLEAALRKRVKGLDSRSAETELAKDRDLLARWLKDKPDHPAHWIHGFLLSPDLAAHLTEPAEPPPPDPEIFLEPPEGWKIKKVPFRLDLKAGKMIGSILPIDEFSFEHALQERGQVPMVNQPGQLLTLTTEDVSCGECRGRKFVRLVTGSFQVKQVDYLLRVPGGFVWIQLLAMPGVNFDESPLDVKLHTVRLNAPLV